MEDFMKKNFYKQRTAFEQSSAARHKELSFPDTVTEYKDIPYLNDDVPAHRMDIFRPKGKDGETLPVIVDVHGGGMIIGNKEFNRYFCAVISAMGYLVFSVEYRLVPDVQVYEQFADLSAAMDHIRKLIPEYSGDPGQVYAIADSGGAYLLTYSIAMQRSKALAAAAHVTPTVLKVNALGLISGMFYTSRFDKIGIFLPRYLYGKNYKKSAFAPYIDPEHPDIVTSLPPCYLITSHDDMLRHYTLNFEKALTKHGVVHELVDYPKDPRLTHAFSVFYPFLPESTDAITSMLRFLRSY